jgi:hypothetical protein
MFRFPIPLPPSSHYRTLGLGPEASADEIRLARKRVATEIEGEKARLSKRVAEVESQARALLEQEGKAAGGDEAGKAALARAAVGIQADYSGWVERIEQLTEDLLALNRIPLENPKERKAYDQANPPFALLALSTPSAALVEDPRTANHLLLLELASFLEARGQRVSHFSDLVRRDFTRDFTHHPALDRKEK